MPVKKTPTKGSGSGDGSFKTPTREAKAPRTPGSKNSVLGSGPGSTSKKKRRFEEKEWNFTHSLPSSQDIKSNGRVEGRNLITWTRPRMSEKLLLHLLFECSRHQVEIPWDAIAHRFHPGSSGSALVQHLNRLRSTLIAEGHLVPPLAQKPGVRSQIDPTIRGYIRDEGESGDVYATRPVKFDEKIEDRKFNLPDAYDNPNGGSGQKVSKPVGFQSPSTPSKRGHSSIDGRTALPFDAENFESDGEYGPAPKRKRNVNIAVRRSNRATSTSPKYVDASDVELEDEEDDDGETRDGIIGGGTGNGNEDFNYSKDSATLDGTITGEDDDSDDTEKDDSNEHFDQVVAPTHSPRREIKHEASDHELEPSLRRFESTGAYMANSPVMFPPTGPFGMANNASSSHGLIAAGHQSRGHNLTYGVPSVSSHNSMIDWAQVYAGQYNPFSHDDEVAAWQPNGLENTEPMRQSFDFNLDDDSA